MSDLHTHPKRTILLAVAVAFFLGVCAAGARQKLEISRAIAARADANAAGRRTMPACRQAVTANPLMASIAGVEPPSPAAFHPISPSRVVRMRVTAYCPCKRCCGPQAHGVTASGLKITGPGVAGMPRIVAADRSIPFGTRIDVPGYGVATVADRGGAIHGNRLDVAFATHEQARAWGVRTLDVRIER